MFSRIFVSNVRNFVRVPPKDVYGNLLYFLQKDLNLSVESDGVNMLITARLKGMTKLIGFAVYIRILPEGEASAVELSFTYKGFFAFTLALLIGIIILSVAFSSMIPLLMVIIPFLLIRYLGSTSSAFQSSVNDFFVLLERDRDQRSLAENRKRWQADLRKADDLYRRLREKHIKEWGDSHALEYKITEYVRMGLTREEAIRKIAEEEARARARIA